MNRREKTIAIAAVIIGAGLSAFIGMWIMKYSWAYFVFAFFTMVGFLTLAAMTVAMVMDTRREEQSSSYHGNWGFDKSYEE